MTDCDAATQFELNQVLFGDHRDRDECGDSWDQMNDVDVLMDDEDDDRSINNDFKRFKCEAYMNHVDVHTEDREGWIR